ncbi:protein-disulfide reductase DsbD family protein [Tellurirhabdus rosea]|uniref:protein-disulfide reductase DsbD family protein n=1 Tax=Tellurirhabdus rosea TaxID=2674997 RepID=UPI00224E0056|nr:cytochrome c biogenesis protein CcdA [Tellurirhabdus rosea]
MKRVKLIFLLFAALVTSLTASAQFQNHATWQIEPSQTTARVGDVLDIRLKATIDPEWYLYSSDMDPNLGPTLTTITLKPNDTYQLVGKLVSVNPKEKYEEVWGGNIRYFTREGIFIQKIKVLKSAPVLEGTVDYQTCSEKNGLCVQGTSDFRIDNIKVEAGATAAASTSAVSASAAAPLAASASPTDSGNVEVAEAPASNPDSAVATAENAPEVIASPEAQPTESLLGFAIAAFLSGLLALLTPCVFPIIPMTVSYFTKQDHGFAKALLYGVSIIGIYVLIGTLVSRINGPAFANFVSTHWLPNLLFFAIFFVFGLSFLGLFEIVLPSSLVNKADAQSERGGVVGILFMAFTLVLVSFSCTGPIVGSLLVASAGGEVVKPIVGMAAFSSAFAIPFTLFAAFPQWLKSLPKSGGWLNSVKVVLGFLELALALKFLSIADQVYHWNLLDREVFLAFWIVLFSLIGFYLLGKIRLPHDSEVKTISIPRLLLAIATFSFVVYMIPGLFGAPLKALAGYLPPQSRQAFAFAANSGVGSGPSSLQEVPKFAELFRDKTPHGIEAFYDYKQALAYAKKVNKPVFIDFTGHGCVNCREMEARVWAEQPVLNRLHNDFVVVALYVDDKTELPESDWYKSAYDGKQKTTIGAQNADLQITKYNNNAQPHYCIVDADGKLLVQPKNYDLDINNFVNFLDSGKQAFSSTETLVAR